MFSRSIMYCSTTIHPLGMRLSIHYECNDYATTNAIEMPTATFSRETPVNSLWGICGNACAHHIAHRNDRSGSLGFPRLCDIAQARAI